MTERVRALGDDRGGATVLVLAIGLVTLLVAIASAAVGGAVVARHRAQTAADLAALAGALDSLDGVEVACARAGEIAARNGGHLTACDVDGLDVVVTVEARPTGLAAMGGTARASARAGPVESVEIDGLATPRPGPVDGTVHCARSVSGRPASRL